MVHIMYITIRLHMIFHVTWPHSTFIGSFFVRVCAKNLNVAACPSSWWRYSYIKVLRNEMNKDGHFCKISRYYVALFIRRRFLRVHHLNVRVETACNLSCGVCCCPRFFIPVFRCTFVHPSDNCAICILRRLCSRKYFHTPTHTGRPGRGKRVSLVWLILNLFPRWKWF